ncbi:hypothetical protein TPA0910_57590 [Streptomyces hygroscopicus subsp. sporocinereus]|uniref:Integrase n=1 Tax=Streptomyces hygroscopicus TaxID=1912 RepID=A0ABQ3U7X7_STRHY|nr:hypothetical protein TPA0910_57590 [Streptomyces hygroscopicus]
MATGGSGRRLRRSGGGRGIVSGGASVKQVQLVLGHASAVITLRIYAHLWPGEEDRTRAVMDAVLGGLRTGCGQLSGTTRESAGQAA